jgi:hypothetical protein
MKPTVFLALALVTACGGGGKPPAHPTNDATKAALIGVWRGPGAADANVRELRLTADEFSLSTPKGCIANAGCASTVALGAWSLAGDQLTLGDPPVAYTVALGGDGSLTLTARADGISIGFVRRPPPAIAGAWTGDTGGLDLRDDGSYTATAPLSCETIAFSCEPVEGTWRIEVGLTDVVVLAAAGGATQTFEVNAYDATHLRLVGTSAGAPTYDLTRK